MPLINPLTNKRYQKGDLFEYRELLNYFEDVFKDYDVFRKYGDNPFFVSPSRAQTAELYDHIYKMIEDLKDRVRLLEEYNFEKHPVDRHGDDIRDRNNDDDEDIFM